MSLFLNGRLFLKASILFCAIYLHACAVDESLPSTNKQSSRAAKTHQCLQHFEQHKNDNRFPISIRLTGSNRHQLCVEGDFTASSYPKPDGSYQAFKRILVYADGTEVFDIDSGFIQGNPTKNQEGTDIGFMQCMVFPKPVETVAAVVLEPPSGDDLYRFTDWKVAYPLYAGPSDNSNTLVASTGPLTNPQNNDLTKVCSDLAHHFKSPQERVAQPATRDSSNCSVKIECTSPGLNVELQHGALTRFSHRSQSGLSMKSFELTNQGDGGGLTYCPAAGAGLDLRFGYPPVVRASAGPAHGFKSETSHYIHQLNYNGQGKLELEISTKSSQSPDAVDLDKVYLGCTLTTSAQ